MTEYKLKSGNILRIYPDEDAESPNTWGDTDKFLVYEHRHFTVPRKGFDVSDIFNPLHTYRYGINYFIFPVEAYIHSGISLYLASGDKQCVWDSTISGCILIKRDSLSDISDIKPEVLAKDAAQALIEAWNQFLRGDVYRFELIEPIDIARNYTNLIIEQFDKTKYLTKQGRNFADTMIYDILTTNIKISDYKELNSCGGYYAENESKAVLEILSELEEELINT